MGNTDWWAQSEAPRTAEQRSHAQEAAKIERQWQEEAQEIAEERMRRKISAFYQMGLGAVLLLLGFALPMFVDLGAFYGLFFGCAFLFGYSGFRQLLRSI